MGDKMLRGWVLTIIVFHNDDIHHRPPNNGVKSDGNEHDREAFIFLSQVVSNDGELETDLMIN